MIASRPRARQRGFTLIELMVAMVIMSLMVGMILAIFTRMSSAYREQSQIANVQQILMGARSMIERDAKQAGYGCTTGFRLATDGQVGSYQHSPVVVTDSSTGPDQIAFYYGDPSVQAAVTNTGGWPATVTVDDASAVKQNMLLLVTTPDLSTSNPIAPTTDAKLATFDACVVQVGSVAGNVITLSTATPWGVASQTHCSTPVINGTMIYQFTARAYRIDPARQGDGVLQVSPTGNLQANTTDWQDLAYGFTDLQAATQFFESGDTNDTPDPDTDPQRDWYSGTQQTTYTNRVLRTAQFVPPLQMSISLVARTDRDVEGIATSATPTLLVSGSVDNNIIGNRASVDLTTTTDPTLTGNRIYRYTTFRADLRNMGVGR